MKLTRAEKTIQLDNHTGVNYRLFQLNYFYIDIVIADQIIGNCTEVFEIENSYSYNFVVNKDVIRRIT